MSQNPNILYNRNFCVLLNSNIPSSNWCIQDLQIEITESMNTNDLLQTRYFFESPTISVEHLLIFYKKKRVRFLMVKMFCVK